MKCGTEVALIESIKLYVAEEENMRSMLILLSAIYSTHSFATGGPGEAVVHRVGSDQLSNDTVVIHRGPSSVERVKVEEKSKRFFVIVIKTKNQVVVLQKKKKMLKSPIKFQL